MGAAALVVLTFVLQDHSTEEKWRTRIELRVRTPDGRERKIPVGTAHAECQSEGAAVDEPVAVGATVYQLECYDAGYGTYVDVVRSAPDRLTIRWYEQPEALEGRERPRTYNAHVIAQVAIPKNVRFSVEVK